MREDQTPNALQIFDADGRWLAEADDLDAARVACVQLAEDGELLALQVEHNNRFAATFDGTFWVHQDVRA